MKTGYYRIIDENFWYQIEEDFPVGGGVYELYCMNGNGLTIPVQRMLGSDEDGILYIGMASNFLDRVINLKKSISPKYKSVSHECGTRYKASTKTKELYPYQNLFVNLTLSEDYRLLEREKMSIY